MGRTLTEMLSCMFFCYQQSFYVLLILCTFGDPIVLYCSLGAHVRSRCFINIILHYIALYFCCC